MQQILPRTRSGAIKPPTFGIPTPGGNPPYCKLAAAPLWQSHRSREGRFPFIPRTTESAVHITTRRTNDAELGCLASSTTSRATRERAGRRVGVSLGSYAARRCYAFSAIFESSDRSKSLCSFG